MDLVADDHVETRLLEVERLTYGLVAWPHSRGLQCPHKGPCLGAARRPLVINRPPEVVLVDFGLPDHLTRVLELMRSYRDVPASLADACLVCMAEEKGGSRVFTTDSDFRTYRKNKRQVIPVFMP